jgi:hypothetical protein
MAMMKPFRRGRLMVMVMVMVRLPLNERGVRCRLSLADDVVIIVAIFVIVFNVVIVVWIF